MSTETQKVDVMAVMRHACRVLNDEGLFNPGDGLCKATRAVAELIKASSRTIRTFEAYGKANGLVAEDRARQECEAAMVAQKEALARVGGAACDR